jgi:hypothetical protein
MDPTVLDTLVRSFATAGTLRRRLSLLAVLPLGVMLGVVDGEETSPGMSVSARPW